MFCLKPSFDSKYPLIDLEHSLHQDNPISEIQGIEIYSCCWILMNEI